MKTLTGIPKAIGSTGTLNGSAESTFITFLIAWEQRRIPLKKSCISDQYQLSTDV
jgi:hypothetical protein